MTTDVFISYSRKDTKTADQICKAFDKVGITYFIDRQSIAGGMEITDVLAQAILDANIFLFLGSRYSYESKFTNSEIMWAFNKKEKNHIVPYLLDDSPMPNGLQFAFIGINMRNIGQHPIEPTLIDDILTILKKKRPDSKSQPSDNDPVYDSEQVDEAPIFGLGRVDSFYVWLKEQANVMTSTMAYHKKRYMCIVSYVVRRDGRVTDVTCTDKNDPILAQIVADIVRRSPKWKPGKKNHKPVSVKMVTAVKIEFKRELPKGGFSIGDIVELEGSRGIIFEITDQSGMILSMDETELPVSVYGKGYHAMAYEWCKGHGKTRWGLPTIAALETIYQHKRLINGVLSKNQSPLISDIPYWSSDEIGYSESKYFHMGEGRVGTAVPTDSKRVRAVGMVFF